MGYTFKAPIPVAFSYTSKAGVITNTAGANSGIKNFAYFTNSGVTVGDWVAFAVWSSNGNANEIGRTYLAMNFDVATPLVATAITGVWEYCTYPASTAIPVWQPLQNIKDGTNCFQNAGANKVSWKIPLEWSNRGNPSLPPMQYYVWYIRFRITALTNLTVGGSQHATNVITADSNTIVADAVGTIGFTDIYNADKAGTRTLESRSVTAVEATIVNNTDVLYPADYYTLGGSANDLYITVTGWTGAGTSTIRLTGTDRAGNVLTEDITFTANGTYYTTKSFRTLEQSQVTVFTPTSYSFTLTQKGWGVVSKFNATQFEFKANLYLKGATTFNSLKEQVNFINNTIMLSQYNSVVINIGNVYAGAQVHNGTSFMFESSSNADYSGGSFLGNNSTLYNIEWKHKQVNYYAQWMQGSWGGGIGQNDGQLIGDANLSDFRSITFNNPKVAADSVILDIGMNEFEGCLMSNFKIFGSSYGLRSYVMGGGVPIKIHKADLSGAISGCVNPWYPDTGANYFTEEYVDCNWGTFADAYKFRWMIQGSGAYKSGYGYEVYSMLTKFVDEKGNPIQNGKVTVTDITGAIVFNGITTAEGYMTDESGTVTSATATTLTDSTKNWSTAVFGQLGFREIFITSGTGKGQRVYVKGAGNTATTLQTTPSWAPQIDTTSKYIVVPYFRVKSYTPTDWTGGLKLSTVANLNPFTIKIQKPGLQTYINAMTIDRPLSGEIAMKRSVIDLI